MLAGLVEAAPNANVGAGAELVTAGDVVPKAPTAVGAPDTAAKGLLEAGFAAAACPKAGADAPLAAVVELPPKLKVGAGVDWVLADGVAVTPLKLKVGAGLPEPKPPVAGIGAGANGEAERDFVSSAGLDWPNANGAIGPGVLLVLGALGVCPNVKVGGLVA